MLPPGIDVKQLDFNTPVTSLSEFQAAILKSASVGMGVSYIALTSDYTGVTYSSARSIAMDDISQFRSIQRWFINIFVRRVYQEWLKVQLLTNAWGLNIPFDKYIKFSNVNYRGRSFNQIDPQKESNADVTRLKSGLTSWSSLIEKSGADPEAVFQQIAQDKKRMDELGITNLIMLDEAVAMSKLTPPDSSAA